MKSIFLSSLLISTTLLSSQNIKETYEEALKYEKMGDYKNAMKIYKEIALKEKELNDIFVDEDKEKEIKVVSNVIDTIDDKETEQTIIQMLSSSFNLYPYYENYLLPFSYVSNAKDGRKKSETKFQLSVKKPIAHNLLGLNESLYFGYTQTSWWQLYAPSSPFRETNYKPEVFMMIPYGKKDHTALKALKLGFLHESNGQDTPKSRSWNRLYAESYFQVDNLFINPRVWYRIPENEGEDDNPDLEDYLGYGDLNFILPYKSHNFKLLLRNNLKFNGENKGFTELSWTFPLMNSKNSFGYLQLSNGYGDSLIDYNKDLSRFSFGISLSR